MKKGIFLSLILLLGFASCIKETKLGSRKESPKNIIHNDTIFGNLKFGYNEIEVYRSLNIKKGAEYSLPIFDNDNIGLTVRPCYYNDSLYSISFILFDAEYKYKDIVDVYTIKYGKPDSIYSETIIDTKKKVTFWRKRNLGVKIETYMVSKFTTTSIEYEDLSRKFGKNLILDKAHPISFFTKNYYNNVYLPRKKKSLNGI